MVYSNTSKHCPYYLKRRYNPASGKKSESSVKSPPEKEGNVDLTV
jgi:hypothetical protein